MEKYKKNIKLEYFYFFFRSFNLTHGIWIAFLGIIKGFGPIEIGVFESVFHFSSITMEIPTGMYGDIFGRKNSRVLSVLIYIIYILLMLFSNNFIVLSIAFFLCGLSYTFESGSGEALIYDSLKKTNDEASFKRVAGNKEIIFQLSSGIAMIIAGAIALYKYEYNLVLMIIILLIGLIPLLKMTETLDLEEKHTESFKERLYNHFVKSTKIVFKDKRLLFLIIIGALMAAPVTVIFFYFQLYLVEDLLYTTFYMGLLLASHSVFGALGGYFADILEKKFREKIILYIIPIFLVIMFWMIQIEAIVFIPFALLGFFDSIFYVVLSDYINHMIPSKERATILSFNSFAFSIVMIIVFPIIGYIAENKGFKYSFFILAIIISVFLAGLLFTLLTNKHIQLKED